MLLRILPYIFIYYFGNSNRSTSFLQAAPIKIENIITGGGLEKFFEKNNQGDPYSGAESKLLKGIQHDMDIVCIHVNCILNAMHLSNFVTMCYQLQVVTSCH